jgi:para-nitrobenzyl esterase
VNRTPHLILAAAAACAACLAGPAPVDTVHIDTGAIKGSVSGAVVSFKGIPYAASPTGENRWRAPQPVAPWKGVRPATDYGADCAQNPFPGDAAPLGVPPKEDCLYANVWAPAAKSSKLPVMVWIYGGGFVNGGSSPSVYAGDHFADLGVVFVSFNYRLGRFGFFAHPALTAESPNSPIGNYGYLDQIAALKWVRRNIAKFGGDPSSVTIFGESAGGMSVLTLMTSPLSQGLFQKAIVESGGGRTGMTPRRLHESAPNLPSGEEVGIAFAKKNGIEGTDAAALAKLRALPAERVIDGLNMMGMGNPTYGGPMIDGKIVTGTPEEIFATGKWAKVPVMIGANSSDIGFGFARNMDELFARFGTHAAEARAAYDPEKSDNLRAVSMLVAADQMMVEPARFVARTVAAAGLPAYEYRFSYVAESMRKQWKGAPHATEIPFVFDTVAARYGKDLAPADEATAKAANAYWVAFAKTGDPNGAGRPKWPRANAKTDELMNFTNDGPVPMPDPWKARLDLTEGLAEHK